MNLAIYEQGVYLDVQEPYCTDHFCVAFKGKDGRFALLTPQVKGEDLIRLAHIVEASGAKEIVECGSFVGQTTCLLGLLAKRVGGHVTTIDNFKGNPGTGIEGLPFNTKLLLERNIARYELEKYIDVVEGDTRCISKECDLVFLDAGHTYIDVKLDIDHWWPLIREGGTMCGHDLDSDVWNEKYIHDDYVDGTHHGVVKAVNETFKTRVRRYVGNSSMWYVKKQNST